MNKAVKVGSKVRWTSAAGKLQGRVTKYWFGMNAAKQLVPWILVETKTTTAMLCASESNLAMMNVEVR